jgi:hypothetical protein
MRADAESSDRRAFLEQSRAGDEALRRKANSLARSWRLVIYGEECKSRIFTNGAKGAKTNG